MTGVNSTALQRSSFEKEDSSSAGGIKCMLVHSLPHQQMNGNDTEGEKDDSGSKTRNEVS